MKTNANNLKNLILTDELNPRLFGEKYLKDC